MLATNIDEFPTKLRFKSSRSIEIVDVESIEWIESCGNYIKVCLSDDAFITRQTMSKVQNQLDPSHFIRIHRSHIINIQQVNKITSLGRGDYNLFLRCGTLLKLSRNYKSNFFHQLDNTLMNF